MREKFRGKNEHFFLRGASITSKVTRVTSGKKRKKNRKKMLVGHSFSEMFVLISHLHFI